MPIPDKINNSLAENLITILSTDDVNGKIIANLIHPELFEGEYRVICERLITFWEQQDEAPKSHTADLFDDILEKGDRRSTSIRRTLINMAQYAKSVNTKYVVDQITKFTRLQLMKDAIIKSAEKINNAQDMAIEEVEGIWHELLRAQQVTFDPGIGLSDTDHALKYLERRNREFDFGIPALTIKGIVPSRGTLTMFLGAKGIGKSWSIVHCGKHNLIKRHKVLHVTTENSAEETQIRYYQSIFSIPQRASEEILLAKFMLNEREEISGFEHEKMKISFALDSPVIEDELHAHIEQYGARLANLRIKQFPTRELTLNGLHAYLDSLEIHEKFVPDLLLIDAPYLMKTDAKDYRISLGRLVEGVRGLAGERNLAIVGTHQLGREAIRKGTGRSFNISEDISIVQTADTVISISRTEAEKALNLARMYVDHSRQSQDSFGFAITQNLPIGQFCLSTWPLSDTYWKAVRGTDNEEDETDDEN